MNSSCRPPSPLWLRSVDKKQQLFQFCRPHPLCGTSQLLLLLSVRFHSQSEAGDKQGKLGESVDRIRNVSTHMAMSRKRLLGVSWLPSPLRVRSENILQESKFVMLASKLIYQSFFFSTYGVSKRCKFGERCNSRCVPCLISEAYWIDAGRASNESVEETMARRKVVRRSCLESSLRG